MNDIKDDGIGDTDPFTGARKPDGFTTPLLVARIIGAVALVCYGWWFLVQIVTNLRKLIEIEAGALERLWATLAGGIHIPEFPSLWWIWVCIFSAYYIVVWCHRWYRVLLLRWRWVRVYPCIFRRILVSIEFIGWVLVTICTIIIVLINIWVLVPRLF